MYCAILTMYRASCSVYCTDQKMHKHIYIYIYIYIYSDNTQISSYERILSAFDIKLGKSVLTVMHADCDLLGCCTAQA